MDHSPQSTLNRLWSVRREVRWRELHLALVTDGEDRWAIRKGGALLVEGHHEEIAYVWDVLTHAIFGPEESRS